ncbi:MAG: Deoxyguanosinetriphosphate triphosphohydrolase-like protein [Candidatus Methanolliviera sp. GoM_asphalt]|nr:MAG: Deoxyguanosinetriphosphate triphosphohydrolase-like protein [Candidatus Methanolliviera sp. GoM_asphalt]
MKVIRDPVHKTIRVDGLCLRLIDTPEMQRLRRIKQLGFSYLVYPGANHTRFEHSLGVMHLADIFSANLDEKERDELMASALLHDIGHGPYSHDSEEIIKRYTRKDHEDVGEIIDKEPIGSILEDFNLKKSEILRTVMGESSLGKIISGEIDLDKMDYLVRDSYYTGVSYGIIDLDRLVQEMNFYQKKLVIGEGGLQAAESLCVSRFLMSPTVYYHHVSRIAESMFNKALLCMIEEKDLDPYTLRRMDDYEIHYRMRRANEYPHEIIKRLEERDLFKRAIYVGMNSIDEKKIDEYRRRDERYERELAEAVGIDEKYVIIDVPKYPKTQMGVPVLINDDIKMLDDVSPLVAILEKAEVSNWKMGVYTPKEYREKVKKSAEEIFEVKKEPKQISLDLN